MIFKNTLESFQLYEAKIHQALDKYNLSDKQREKALDIHQKLDPKISAKYADVIAKYGKDKDVNKNLHDDIAHFDKRILINLDNKNPNAYSHREISAAVNTHKEELKKSKKDFIYKDDRYEVANPKSYSESCKLGMHHGRNSWCIASKNSEDDIDNDDAPTISGEEAWSQYSANNDIYFIYDRSKKAGDKGSKFAFLIDKNGNAEKNTYTDADDNLTIPKMSHSVANAIKTHVGKNFPYIIGKGKEQYKTKTQLFNLVDGERDGIQKTWHDNGQLEFEHNYVKDKVHGTQRAWYKNGQLESEHNYVKGKAHGIHRVWYDDGQLESEHNYVNGEAHGIHKEWHPNGQLRSERNYVNGERDGIQKTWHDNGQLESEHNYVNGERDGILRTLHDNGQLRFEGNYVKDKEHGIHRAWFTNGQLDYEHNYVNGEFDGTQRSWHDNGQLYSEGNYIKGKEHGTNRIWHDNGQLRFEGNYVKGKAHGIHREWHPNGQLRSKDNYTNNGNSTHKSWHPNGQLSSEYHRVDGEQHGVYKSWHPNGQLRSEGNYKKGKAHGIHRVWYDDGQLDYELNYVNGKIID